MPPRIIKVDGVFEEGAVRLIPLIPGRNTGTREHPCPECKTTSEHHFTHCRHYLYQQQYKEN